VAGFVVGLFITSPVIAIGRQIAFGHGFGVSPVGLAASAQFLVVTGWFFGASIGTWLATWIARSSTPGLFVSGWLFHMAWLSPGVRPAELAVRLACSIAIVVGGVGAVVAQRTVSEKRRAAA
jgi:hypothetical protein